jgi:hypothetical protein
MLQNYNHFSERPFHKKHQYFHNKNKSNLQMNQVYTNNVSREQYNFKIILYLVTKQLHYPTNAMANLSHAYTKSLFQSLSCF